MSPEEDDDKPEAVAMNGKEATAFKTDLVFIMYVQDNDSRNVWHCLQPWLYIHIIRVMSVVTRRTSAKSQEYSFFLSMK